MYLWEHSRPLAKFLDHGSDLHSLEAHAWSDAEENRSLSLSDGSERFFRRPRQKQDDPLKGSLSENILTMLCRANCWQGASLGAFQEADRGLYVEKKFQALVPGEHKLRFKQGLATITKFFRGCI